MEQVYATRRLMCLWLPFIVMGMTVMLYSYTFTLTANGLTFLGIGAAGVGAIAAALDSEDS